MNLHDSLDKKWIKRIAAIAVITLGLVFGVTWNSRKFCFGDHIFMALGLPVWSNGTSGTHYPAIVATVLILIGMSVLNTTLQKKPRFWLWMIVVLILIILNLGFVI